MLDFLLIMSLGFLGSFGHCVGMCGPIAVAFALSEQPHSKHPAQPTAWQQLRFHGLLNLGRILSYALVGAGIGALGSVLIAGGQLAGVGSDLRRIMSLLTGGLLIWFGLSQINPMLPKLPLLNPMAQGKLHDRLSRAMVKLSLQKHGWTPALLGFTWGFIPCGFLYAAQIKAAETGNLWQASLTMLAFGLGTLPTMLGVGISSAWMSRDRRSQFFRLGGWVTLAIGILTLLRTGSTMVDYTGYAALLCLILALIARPINRIWAFPLRYRRALGVGAFVLSLAHTIHTIAHAWDWQLVVLRYLLPQHQWGIAAGTAACVLMAPAALTSFDGAQRSLGNLWRRIHLLTVPALVLSVIHALLIGARFLGAVQLTWINWAAAILLSAIGLGVLLIRCRWAWRLFWLEKSYLLPPPAK
jgi:hypothetical protein